MSQLTRRIFLERAGRTGLALGAWAGLEANVARAVEPFARLGSPRLRLSLAAYSFREFFNHRDPARRITLFDFIDFCGQHGCLGTELTSFYFPKDFDRAYLLELKRRAFLAGLAVSGTAVGNNFARADGPDLEREVASVKQWVDHAAVLGAPHIRVFAGDARGLDPALAKRQCIRALEECGDYAAQKGVWLGLENHGGIVAQVADLLDIVRAVRSAWVGVNLDTGNFYGPADPYEEMARLAPYAVNVQVKVEVNRRGQGKEPTDLARVTNLLRQANYQGFVALEYEAAPDPWQAVPEWLARLRTALAAA